MQTPANNDKNLSDEMFDTSRSKLMKADDGCYPVSSYMHLGRSISRRTGLKACLELDIYLESNKSTEFELEEEIHALFQSSCTESKQEKKVS
jgi:hypothetical protein